MELAAYNNKRSAQLRQGSPVEDTVIVVFVLFGCQLDVFFNVETDLGEPAFEVSTVLLDDYLNSFKVMICTRYVYIYTLVSVCARVCVSVRVCVCLRGSACCAACIYLSNGLSSGLSVCASVCTVYK